MGRILVVTVVHTPLDARIHAREIASLLDQGHDVVYAAPISAYGVDAADVDPRIAQLVDLPRAARWNRLWAWQAVVRLLRRARRSCDVVVVHDPELLLPVAASFTPLPVVWDVHEDLSMSFADKPWVPSWVVPSMRRIVHRLERWAEGRCHLLLAEPGYAQRFGGRHPVVPNFPLLPEAVHGPHENRVVYLGRVSMLRGARELIEVGRRLAADGITTEIIGAADRDVRDELERAAARGWVEYRGFVPNAEALRRLDGALAGLSLLHDHPNYVHSMPTKVLEYQAAGVPVVTTPLPEARAVVENAGSGTVVPFGDVDAVVSAVRRLRRDPKLADAQARAGRADAESGRSWGAVAGAFVAAVTAASAPSQRPG